LTAEQQSALAQLSSLATDTTTEAAQQGLALLSDMSLSQCCVLPHVMQWQVVWMARLGLSLEAQELQMWQLFYLNDESMWLRYGAGAPHWLRAIEEAAPDVFVLRLQQYIEALETVLAEQQLPMVQLLWVDAHLRLPDSRVPDVLSALGDALDASVWTKQPELVASWSSMISQGLGLCLQQAHLAQQSDTLAHWNQAVLRFPWERVSKEWGAGSCHLLCKTLSTVGLDDTWKRLLGRVGGHFPDESECGYWQARMAAEEGEEEQAFEGFCVVAERYERLMLDDDDWLVVVDWMFSLQRHADIEPFLQCLTQRHTPAFLEAALLFVSAIGQWEAARVLVDEFGDSSADMASVWCFRVGVSCAGGEWERAEEEIYQFLKDCPEAADLSPVNWSMVHVLWGWLSAKTERWGKAVALFREHWPRVQVEKGHPWATHIRVCEWLGDFGDAFRKWGDDNAALQCYLQALQYQPSESMVHRAVGLLLHHQQFSSAGVVLEQGLQHFPESKPLWYARFLVAKEMEEWEQSEQALETIGREWFVAHDMADDWLLSCVRLDVARGRLFGAFERFEDDLERIVTHEQLARIRLILLKELKLSYQQLRESVGGAPHADDRTASILRELPEQVQAPQAAQEWLQERETLLGTIEALKQQPEQASDLLRKLCENEWEELWLSLPGEPTWLRPESLSFLQSAQLLWHQLADHPEQDHSPVVLQLARVLEGEVNRSLIDPLAKWAVQEYGSLGFFPATTFDGIRPDANRLSLGNAARMLYHTLHVPEADGSVTVRRNPYSNDQHAACLRAFWALPRWDGIEQGLLKRLQEELPLALEDIGGLRNRAGHARHALRRQHAQRVRALFFGASGDDGILSLLLLLAQVYN
jgi:hypothetical protein